jgi:hypothetical protein
MDDFQRLFNDRFMQHAVSWKGNVFIPNVFIGIDVWIMTAVSTDPDTFFKT